jgi:hypothetical protein
MNLATVEQITYAQGPPSGRHQKKSIPAEAGVLFFGPSGFCVWFFDGGVVFKLCRESFVVSFVVSERRLTLALKRWEVKGCSCMAAISDSDLEAQSHGEMPTPCGEKGSTKLSRQSS